MPVIIDDVPYYSHPQTLVVDSSGVLVASTTATSVTTPGGDPVDLKQPGTLVDQSDLSTGTNGVIEAFLADAAQVAVNFGSSGVFVITSDEVGALAASYGVGGYMETIGDGVNTSFILIHGLGTLDVQVQVYDTSDGTTVLTSTRRLDTNRVLVDFGAIVPASGGMRALIMTNPSTVSES